MLLSDQQRAEFSRWLEQQISTSEGIQEQMGKTSLPPAALDALLKKERSEQMACKIVLRTITSGESMSIGGA